MPCIRRFAAALIAALLIGSGLTACGGSDSHDNANVSYSPAAYGEVVNGVGHCYYDDDVYEAQQLLADGSCPAGWIAYPMPLYWHTEYYSYYSSPAYYNRYVLVSHRTVYVTHETTFRTTYSTQITTASKIATYKGSNGKTVTGPATAKMKFSSGSGSTTSRGGGSLRNGGAGGSGTSGGTTGGSKSSSGGMSGGSLRGGRK